jgi:starch synthase
MRILIATPEANPFARTGGLAEVVSCLACALNRLGHQVAVVMPLYRQAREAGNPPGRSAPRSHLLFYRPGCPL